MLSLDLVVKSDELTNALTGLGGRAESAIARGLREIIQGVYREAHARLSGPGRKKVRTRNYGQYINEKGKRTWNYKKTQARGQADMLGGRPGSFPVPVITNNLRSHLYMVMPGQTKSARTFKKADRNRADYGMSPTASNLQAMLWNAAEYAATIHEGKGSSKKYGSRPFATEAVEAYDRKVGMGNVLRRELTKELIRLGLKR